MLAVEIQSLAQLYEAHGDKALPEAAQKAQEFEESGDASRQRPGAASSRRSHHAGSPRELTAPDSTGPA